MSEYEARVVRLKDFKKHPDENIENLLLIKVFEYTVVINKNDWKEGDLAIYIEPDTIVNTSHPLFAFLDRKGTGGKKRVTIRKFQNVISYGLLVPLPMSLRLGDIEGKNLWNILELERWQPAEQGKNTSAIKNPPGLVLFKYDVENFMKCPTDVFEDGEMVWVSEKIHGENNKIYKCPKTKEIYCGSRSEWKKKDNNCTYWKAYLKYPQIQDFINEHPGHVLWGECYGKVKGFDYGTNKQISFAGFDIWFDNHFLDISEAWRLKLIYDLPWVPIIDHEYTIKHNNLEELIKMAEGQTLVNDGKHIREGIVIKGLKEKWTKAGRNQLKIVGQGYFNKS